MQGMTPHHPTYHSPLPFTYLSKISYRYLTSFLILEVFPLLQFLDQRNIGFSTLLHFIFICNHSQAREETKLCHLHSWK